MIPAPGAPNDFQPIGLLAVLLIAWCVKHWLAVLRLVAIAIITLAIYGAVQFVQGLHIHG